MLIRDKQVFRISNANANANANANKQYQIKVLWRNKNSFYLKALR
jgi:hypothetical protein